MHITLNARADNFANEMKTFSSVNVYDCYQCGKCSAGCSVGGFTEESPTKLIRYIQLNQREAALNSTTPFICASCNTCSERCPMEIDVAKIMETLRIISRSEGRKPSRDVTAFSDLFLYSVKTTGRLFELGMTAGFNVVSGHLMKDAALGAALFKKGKIAVKPAMSGNTEKTKNIFSLSEKLPHKKKSTGKEKH